MVAAGLRAADAAQVLPGAGGLAVRGADHHASCVRPGDHVFRFLRPDHGVFGDSVRQSPTFLAVHRHGVRHGTGRGDGLVGVFQRGSAVRRTFLRFARHPRRLAVRCHHDAHMPGGHRRRGGKRRRQLRGQDAR